MSEKGEQSKPSIKDRVIASINTLADDPALAMRVGFSTAAGGVVADLAGAPVWTRLLVAGGAGLAAAGKNLPGVVRGVVQAWKTGVPPRGSI